MACHQDRVSETQRVEIREKLERHADMLNKLRIFGDLDGTRREVLCRMSFPVGDGSQSPADTEGVLAFYSHSRDSQASFSPASASFWSAQSVDTRVFSNLFPCKIRLASSALVGDETPEELSPECRWESTEHYFQCGKCVFHRLLFQSLFFPDFSPFQFRAHPPVVFFLLFSKIFTGRSECDEGTIDRGCGTIRAIAAAGQEDRKSVV